MNVVIVESPAKAKTITKYLGKGYEVYASYGHVRDLPAKDGSVDPDHDFTMLWDVDSQSSKTTGGHRQGGEGRRPDYSGDRPGPRGRGDFLARPRSLESEKSPRNETRRSGSFSTRSPKPRSWRR